MGVVVVGVVVLPVLLGLVDPVVLPVPVEVVSAGVDVVLVSAGVVVAVVSLLPSLGLSASTTAAGWIITITATIKMAR